MKVAIIGGGVAGLSCAHELERYGVKPVIFEQRNRVGEVFDHSTATLELFTRPYDPLDYLRDEYNLNIRPFYSLKTIIMNSPAKTTKVNGNLGYLIPRGQSPYSVETQLYNSLTKSTIYFNTRADYSRLAKEYDYVVVANGHFDVTRTLGLWSSMYETFLIGANITGDFDLNTLIMWVDERYTKSAYAYLAPIEKGRAFLGLVVPNSTPDEARDYWRLFWELEKHPWDLVYEIIVQHVSGFVYPHQYHNILLAGAAGGFLEPFLGFGLVSSLQSGVLAGRALGTGKKYEDLLLQLKEDMKHSIVFREMFSNLNNTDLNKLMTALDTPGIKQFIYNTNVDLTRLTTAVVGKIQKYLNN